MKTFVYNVNDDTLDGNDTIVSVASCTTNCLAPMAKALQGSIDAPTRRLLGLSHLWSSVKQNFVFMERVAVNWDSLYVAMIPQIKATTVDGEAVRLLRRMAATLNDGHTYVYSYYPQDIKNMPFATRWVDGKVYVDKVYSSAFVKQGMRRGQRRARKNS